MKLVAIMDRGTKRDYIYMYTLLKYHYSFEELFSLYEEKYHAFESNKFSLVKSLGFFDDADDQELPKMRESVSWEAIKSFFVAESLRLAKANLE